MSVSPPWQLTRELAVAASHSPQVSPRGVEDTLNKGSSGSVSPGAHAVTRQVPTGVTSAPAAITNTSLAKGVTPSAWSGPAPADGECGGVEATSSATQARILLTLGRGRPISPPRVVVHDNTTAAPDCPYATWRTWPQPRGFDLPRAR